MKDIILAYPVFCVIAFIVLCLTIADMVRSISKIFTPSDNDLMGDDR